MNFESRQIIEGFQNDADSQAKAEAWGDAKLNYQEALAEFDRLIQDDPDVIITPDDESLRKELEKCLAVAKSKLARLHRDWGLAALSSKDYSRAVDEFEEAMRLAGDDEVEFLEEIKTPYDKAKVSFREKKIYAEITPFVHRGDDFRKNGNYGEAMLEYQSAMKRVSGYDPGHRFVEYLQEGLCACRRHLIKPYLGRVYRASLAGKYNRAFTILKRALLLLDEHDYAYRAFLNQIKDGILEHVDVEAEETEQFEAPEVWEQAVQDYEEALDLYTSFTQNDPLSPAYTDGNVFEDRFVNSRRNLARLYKNRGDKFRDDAQFQKALRNYKEALKLFPKSDKLFHETFKEMKKLRGQVALSRKES